MPEKKYPPCPLFEGLTEAEIAGELARLQAVEQAYQPGQIVLAAGCSTVRMGLVLEGVLYAILPLPQGRQLLQSRLTRGELFGQLLAVGRDHQQALGILIQPPGRPPSRAPRAPSL